MVVPDLIAQENPYLESPREYASIIQKFRNWVMIYQLLRTRVVVEYVLSIACGTFTLWCRPKALTG
jgi:hypothetical protein